MNFSLPSGYVNSLRELAHDNKNTNCRVRQALHVGPQCVRAEGTGPVKDIDLVALQTACRELARASLWSDRGVPEIAVAARAGEFMHVASALAADLIDSGRDPNIVTRAITYLAFTHVVPSGDIATWWFTEMLTCLLEFAAPSMIQTPVSGAFLNDVRDGLGGEE